MLGSTCHEALVSRLVWRRSGSPERRKAQWEYVEDPEVDFYNFKFNAFIPYVGLQSRYELPNTRLSARVIGFPWLPGSLKYDYQDPVDAYSEASMQGYDKGYFLEASVECVYRALDSMSLGVFASYNILHFAATGDVTEIPGPTHDTLDFSFDRKAWILGGSASVSLDLL